MTDHTTIEWTDATWNQIGGCTRVSEGCRNCYAEIMAARFSGPGQWGEGLARIVRDQNGKAIDHRWTGKLRLNDRALELPLRWRKPRRIFVNSTSDLFHEEVPDEWIDKVFAVMAMASQHTFQVLTKRPQRMQKYLSQTLDRVEAIEERADEYFGINDMPFTPYWPIPNVWLGTSVEEQATADERIPHLLATPAAVRFVSAEPLLGPVDMDAILAPDMGIYALTGIRSDGSGPSGFSQGPRLDWVIVGGESGPGARPMHPDWARSLRDQCQAAGVAYFFKQWGEWAPALHDPEYDGYVLRQTENVGQFDSWRATVFDPNRLEGVNWRRLGKKAAGRLLDGREWNQMPGVRDG